MALGNYADYNLSITGTNIENIKKTTACRL